MFDPSSAARRSSAECKDSGENITENDHSDFAKNRLSTFKEWLNYTLDPSVDWESEYGDSQKSGFDAVLQFRQRIVLRKKCGEVWNGDEMQKIRAKLQDEIRKGKIKIREDRDVHADLCLRKQILSLLFSYSTPWLLFGLETVFDEIILHPHETKDPATNADSKTVKAKLRNFIVARVLSDPEVLEKYTRGLCKVPSGRFEDKFQAEIREFLLYRLLSLFFFLDRAREKNVLGFAPCLFVKEAAVKSTRAVLLAFCRNFLAQEGDFVKRLSRMGLHTYRRQEPLDEIDFRPNNLEADLSDGLVLARLAEIVTRVPFKSMLLQLKMPASSRTLKLQNIRLVLKFLTEHGIVVPEELVPRQLVDGDRGTALKLVRSIVTRYNLGQLVNEEKLRLEINEINHSDGEYQDPEQADKFQEGRLRLLLLLWCDAICSKYGVAVSNLTTDFSDGVVVLLLLHYYLPNLVVLNEIMPTSRTATFLDPLESEKDIRRNARQNCELANSKLLFFGGIQRMIPPSDSSNIPDPKAVLLCLGFIFSRVLDCNKYTNACRIIQKFLRNSLGLPKLPRRRFQKVWQNRNVDLKNTTVLTLRKHPRGSASLCRSPSLLEDIVEMPEDESIEGKNEIERTVDCFSTSIPLKEPKDAQKDQSEDEKSKSEETGHCIRKSTQIEETKEVRDDEPDDEKAESERTSLRLSPPQRNLDEIIELSETKAEEEKTETDRFVLRSWQNQENLANTTATNGSSKWPQLKEKWNILGSFNNHDALPQNVESGPQKIKYSTVCSSDIAEQAADFISIPQRKSLRAAAALSGRSIAWSDIPCGSQNAPKEKALCRHEVWEDLFSKWSSLKS